MDGVDGLRAVRGHQGIAGDQDGDAGAGDGQDQAGRTMRCAAPPGSAEGSAGIHEADVLSPALPKVPGNGRT